MGHILPVIRNQQKPDTPKRARLRLGVARTSQDSVHQGPVQQVPTHRKPAHQVPGQTCSSANNAEEQGTASPCRMPAAVSCCLLPSLPRRSLWRSRVAGFPLPAACCPLPIFHCQTFQNFPFLSVSFRGVAPQVRRNMFGNNGLCNKGKFWPSRFSGCAILFGIAGPGG